MSICNMRRRNTRASVMMSVVFIVLVEDVIIDS